MFFRAWKDTALLHSTSQCHKIITCTHTHTCGPSTSPAYVLNPSIPPCEPLPPHGTSAPSAPLTWELTAHGTSTVRPAVRALLFTTHVCCACAVPHLSKWHSMHAVMVDVKLNPPDVAPLEQGWRVLLILENCPMIKRFQSCKPPHLPS